MQLWLIPILPLAGFLINGLFGRRFSKGVVNAIAIGSVALSFAWVLKTLLGLDLSHPYSERYFTWIQSGAFRVDCEFTVDKLTAVMLLVVTGVGSLIHVYSVGYMAHEGGYYRFFAYLNLFMFFMLTLVLAANYLVLFVGWEGVGLCSYLLIGFYFDKKVATNAGNKAFIVNRIGDAGFILGALTLVWYLGSFRFADINALARSGQFAIGDPVLTIAALLLFVGACGKSAQIPLYVWLPDAMEGPTPVSALIHAATMVTAGVYMVARSNAVFVLAPTAMKTVAIIGALTAVFAASIGLVQNDIKRVLAYSTVSQLGYMFLALGVGAFAAGVFHVFTHAFFKALLFLGSGSVIHALSGEQDLRNMGDLRRRIPTTHWTMLVATLAIAGVFPFAGFFSKDEILWQTYTKESDAYHILWFVGYGTALMTAFYMFRLMYLTFYSPSRMSQEVEHHVHESPKSMTVPLVILAICSIGAGWLSWPHSLGGGAHFENFLEPVFAREAAVFREEGKSAQLAAGEKEAEHTDKTEYALMFLSLAAAGVGWGMARRSYRNAGKDYVEPIAAKAPPLYTVLYNKWFVDEAYDYAFTGRRKIGDIRLGAMGAGEASSWFDAKIIDGAVNDVGWVTRAVATLSTWWDKWIIDGVGVNGPAILARMISYPTRLFEWGLVQWYALVMVAGLLGFGVYYVWK